MAGGRVAASADKVLHNYGTDSGNYGEAFAEGASPEYAITKSIYTGGLNWSNASAAGLYIALMLVGVKAKTPTVEALPNIEPDVVTETKTAKTETEPIKQPEVNPVKEAPEPEPIVKTDEPSNKVGDTFEDGAGANFKLGDKIVSKEIIDILPGTNGKVAVIGRKMDGHVNEVVAKLQNDNVSVEAFNEKFQDGQVFKIDGQDYTWKQIQDDFSNPIDPITGLRKYSAINDKGWIADSDVPNTLMYKANQQWANKLVGEGFEVIDIGYPAGQNLSPSLFYNMEQSIIFPK